LDIPCVHHQGEHTNVRGEDNNARTRLLLLLLLLLLLRYKGLYIKRSHA
jgi:hypothetical protein